MPEQVNYMSLKDGNLYYRHMDYYKALDINSKINLKSWHGGYDRMAELAARVNKVFNSAPAIMTFCGIAQYDCYYGKYKKGARLDGVTDTSIFAAK